MMEKEVGSFAKCMKVFFIAMGIIWIIQIAVTYVGFLNGSDTGKPQETTDLMTADGEIVASNSMGDPFRDISNVLNDVAPYAIVITYVCLLVVFGMWFYRCCKKKVVKQNVKTIFNFKNTIGFLFMGVGACYFLNFVAYMLIPEFMEVPIGHYITLMERIYDYENILVFIAIIFLAPIAEELIFRGVMLHYAYDLNIKEEYKGAIVMQAILFGIMYLYGHCFSGFLMGLLLGYLTYRFHSILPAILVHFILNALSTLTAYPVVNALLENGTLASGAIIALAFLGLCAVGLFLIRKEKEQLSIEEM